MNQLRITKVYKELLVKKVSGTLGSTKIYGEILVKKHPRNVPIKITKAYLEILGPPNDNWKIEEE